MSTTLQDVRAVAGTVASVGAVNAGAGAGRLVGALLRDGRRGRNLAMSWGMDAALRAAGISLDVQGREHLEAPRPAVFMMNHQSELDPLVAGALIRRDTTTTGKKEAKYDPRAGFLGWALDVVHFDRNDREQARGASAELMRRVAEGTSVLIAPEGTRSKGMLPGPFKKGGFHIAMDAGIPIIPIIMRNTGELMPPSGKTMHPGTVDVVVLPPIDTSGWSKETLQEHVDDVRARYIETLENWPA
jgi:putative phosphoserine phosphatase/1-acylglycerol-3-phosphate O-acyltransferase